eukprot:87860-Pelagomonas_calceolata.AAC.1
MPHQHQGHGSNHGLHLARPSSHEGTLHEGSVRGSSSESVGVKPQQVQGSGTGGPLSITTSSSLPPPLQGPAGFVGPLTGSRLPLPPPLSPPPQQHTQQHTQQQGQKSPAEHLSSYTNSLHSTAELNIVDEELRTLVLQMALKCADLGHLTHARDVHRRWVLLLEEEMFRQGDAEKAHGFPPSPLMDRAEGGIKVSRSQVGMPSERSPDQVVLPSLIQGVADTVTSGCHAE